jgi:uncharacterized phage infection (PIP) family protein YhgE
MFRILAITLALIGALIGATSTAHADVWRYVDAKGQVQYSDKWVPGSTLIKTTSPNSVAPPQQQNAPAQTDQQKLATSNANIAEQQARRDTEQTVQQDVAAVKAQQCKRVTEQYQKAIESRRIYKEGKSGEREYISDQEADAYRAELLTQRKQVCGK